MHDDPRKDLARFRLDQAKECLDVAKREIDCGAYRTAVNRSYYCVFHAMRATLGIESIDFRKHSGVIAAFRKMYIKPGIFPTSLSKIITEAFDIRNSSDYEDFFVISKEEVVAQIRNAELFLDAMKQYLLDIVGL